MKKTFIALTAIALFSLPFNGNAQEEKKEKKEIEEKVEITEQVERKESAEKKETEEIIIRNKGDKELNIKVEIKGDQVTVNGQPLAEYKNDKVTINKRKIVIRDGDRTMAFDLGPNELAFGEDFMRQWKMDKDVIKPFLGVTTEKVATGAKITEIVKESAAEKAGLKKDDVITKIGDESIKDGAALSEVIGSKKSKEVVKVSYLRNGKPGSAKATLGERKVQPPMALAFNYPRGNMRSFSMPKISGVPNSDLIYEEQLLHDLDSRERGGNYDANSYFPFENTYPRQKRLGLKIQDTEEGGNVKVIEVEEGSAAEKAGLKKDDIITEIGGTKIENTDDARKQLMPSETKTAYTIKAKRGGKDMSFEVKFPKKLKTASL